MFSLRPWFAPPLGFSKSGTKASKKDIRPLLKLNKWESLPEIDQVTDSLAVYDATCLLFSYMDDWLLYGPFIIGSISSKSVTEIITSFWEIAAVLSDAFTVTE